MTEFNLGGRYVVAEESVVLPGEACALLREVLVNERNAALRRTSAEGRHVPRLVLDVIAAVDMVGQRWKALHARNPSVRGRSEVPDLRPDPPLTTTQAADLLRITPRAVTGLISRGRLEARKVGVQWQVDPDSVEQLRHERGEK